MGGPPPTKAFGEKGEDQVAPGGEPFKDREGESRQNNFHLEPLQKPLKKRGEKYRT